MESIDTTDCTELTISGKVMGYLPMSRYFELKADFGDGDFRTIVGKSKVDLTGFVNEVVSIKYAVLVTSATSANVSYEQEKLYGYD